MMMKENLPVKSSVRRETRSSKNEESLNESQTIYLFRIDKIIDYCMRDGVMQFKVRWLGYEPSDDTWEPKKHFLNPNFPEDYLKRVSKKSEESIMKSSIITLNMHKKEANKEKYYNENEIRLIFSEQQQDEKGEKLYLVQLKTNEMALVYPCNILKLNISHAFTL
uniref:Chromo domain-containing protein n=1 Tax=Parastrongyloides trichosuri TaxID=131310 RepID=A0A0N4ZSJ1_PARTI